MRAFEETRSELDAYRGAPSLRERAPCCAVVWKCGLRSAQEIEHSPESRRAYRGKLARAVLLARGLPAVLTIQARAAKRHASVRSSAIRRPSLPRAGVRLSAIDARVRAAIDRA